MSKQSLRFIYQLWSAEVINIYKIVHIVFSFTWILKNLVWRQTSKLQSHRIIERQSLEILLNVALIYLHSVVKVAIPFCASFLFWKFVAQSWRKSEVWHPCISRDSTGDWGLYQPTVPLYYLLATQSLQFFLGMILLPCRLHRQDSYSKVLHP